MTATNIFFNFVGFRYSPALKLQHTLGLGVKAMTHLGIRG